MPKSDLQARPICHRERDSIEAHLTIVFAALAVSRWIGLANPSNPTLIRLVRTAPGLGASAVAGIMPVSC